MPRIAEMYAFVVEDAGSEDEGIIGMDMGNGWMPFVGADMARVESLKQFARSIGRKSGKRIKILHFTHREELGSV